MKKYFILMIGFVSFFILTGCSNSNNITNIDIQKASSAIDQKYSNMGDLDDTQLSVVYKVDVSLMEEHIIKSSSLNNGDFYALIKVSSKNKKEVQHQMFEMFRIMEEQSNLYSPEAVTKIQNRLDTSVGDYLIYFVGDHNSEMYEVLKEYME
ncbi:MAG: DUF4358 domain-containing protein [Bacilli bacterium]|nr:DUF4358 domain-containing protein [Bacilli bacterium]